MRVLIHGAPLLRSDCPPGRSEGILTCWDLVPSSQWPRNTATWSCIWSVDENVDAVYRIPDDYNILCFRPLWGCWDTTHLSLVAFTFGMYESYYFSYLNAKLFFLSRTKIIRLCRVVWQECSNWLSFWHSPTHRRLVHLGVRLDHAWMQESRVGERLSHLYCDSASLP